jgi:hypothetical protein
VVKTALLVSELLVCLPSSIYQHLLLLLLDMLNNIAVSRRDVMVLRHICLLIFVCRYHVSGASVSNDETASLIRAGSFPGTHFHIAMRLPFLLVSSLQMQKDLAMSCAFSFQWQLVHTYQEVWSDQLLHILANLYAPESCVDIAIAPSMLVM